MGSPEPTVAVNMIPTTRKLADIMGRLQCKTAAYSDYILYVSSSELLRQVWSKVRSVWQDGRSVLRKPKAIGQCTPIAAAAASRPGH